MFAVLLMIGFVPEVHAQGSTATMLEQIAALQTLIGSVEKGYRASEQGLATIRDIRQGEFDLHRTFFQSLSTVDTGVAQMPVVAAILQWRQAIGYAFETAMTRYHSSPWLQPPEKDYVQSVYEKVEIVCGQDGETMGALIRDSVVQMTDGERMRRLTKIGNRMRQRASLVQAFLVSTDLLINRRQQAGEYVGLLSKIYGL
ncbi:MAG TPA: hypothetical protein VGM30_10750 [Puia sp.]